MSNSHSNKLRRVAGGRVAYWCQGCEDVHVIRVEGTELPVWFWNGDTKAPTFTPSILVTYEDMSGRGEHRRCHTFVSTGQVQFLNDFTHQFAGQTLPLPDWPYANGEYGGVEPMEKCP